MTKFHLRLGFGLSHKLLITQEMKPPSRYKRFLLIDETVNGEITKLVFHIRNIGDELIPKGHVEVLFKTPYGMGDYTRSGTSTEIAPIEPNKTVSLKQTINFTIHGLWFVALKVKLKGEKKVEYYQFESAEPDTEEWLHPIHVVDRHQLDLITCIEKLAKKAV